MTKENENSPENIEMARRYHADPDSVKTIAKDFKVKSSYVATVWERWYLREVYPNSEAGISEKLNML